MHAQNESKEEDMSHNKHSVFQTYTTWSKVTDALGANLLVERLLSSDVSILGVKKILII